MVHIAIISAVYPPEPVVSAQMGRDLAEHLANSGARVTVLCPYPSRPLGMEYPDFRPSSAARLDAENGVVVVRLPSFTAPHSRLVVLDSVAAGVPVIATKESTVAGRANQDRFCSYQTRTTILGCPMNKALCWTP